MPVSDAMPDVGPLPDGCTIAKIGDRWCMSALAKLSPAERRALGVEVDE